MKYSYLFDVDAYKSSHYKQYKSGTTSIFSYIESRGGPQTHTLFFGLQYFLKEYFSHRVTPEEVEKAKTFFEAHGEPFNYEGWMYIATELKGKLPIRIRAVPEGTLVETHNILASVESTDPKVPWITSWIEPLLLRLWYPITVASKSYYIKKIIMEALRVSSVDPSAEISFKLHSFGSRGVSSQESAMIGDMGHLVNFMGTDTVVGVLGANEYYNAPMAGFSIPASEHSSITSWGKDNEVEAYRNMIKQFGKPGAIFACVSDSYDIYNACEHLWGEELKQEVIDSGATLVIRPDSGDPVTVVTKVVKILDEKFGSVINTKGYKVLNHVRVIQGDGVNAKSIQDILDSLMDCGYSATNIAFGMGGALLQSDCNRDTYKFAMKCSSVVIDGKEVDVYKDPITDSVKKSKKGRLDLVKVDGKFETVRLFDGDIAWKDSAMRTVYENGELLVEDDFETIRKRTA